MSRFRFTTSVLAALIGALALSVGAHAQSPRNVILCIGDGMGPEHVRAAGLYLNGEAGTLSFEAFPAQGTLSTGAANNPITDSAASATALATGRKVNTGVISVAVPGDGRPLTTILERAQQAGKRVGMVTTSELTHATTAAFAAHTRKRAERAAIAQDFLHMSRPDVLLGGGGAGMTAKNAIDAGYILAQSRSELFAAQRNKSLPLCGLFGIGNMPYEYEDFTGSAQMYRQYPHLREMTMTAIDLLDDDPDGFFLLVEGGRIDQAAHHQNIERTIHEMIEFARTVEEIVQWAKDRDDTLIIVTADHETGGLAITRENGKGEYPTATWSTWGHTPVDVGVYATGVGASLFSGSHDNADLPGLIDRAGEQIAE